MLDPKGRVETWNAGAKRLKGYTGEEIIGQHFSCFYTPEAVKMGYPQRALKIAKCEGQYKEEGWRVRKDGTRFLANMVITAVHDTEGRLPDFANITRDITKQRANEAALRASREQLREFAASLDAELESERHRIAHALHDELGQNLAVMRMYLTGLQRQKSDDPRVVEAVSRLEEIIADSGTAMRRIIADLRPLILDSFGIMAAAEALIQDYVTSTSLKVDLDVSGEFDDLSAHYTTVLYRMLQECFTNIVKHAYASQVFVRLQKIDDGVVLSVSDNGLGISQDDQAKAGSYGLFGMQERAAHYGGRLDIDSSPCTGTTVTLWLPLSGAATKEAEPAERATALFESRGEACGGED
jgi:PAS domain S-box-containing protein